MASTVLAEYPSESSPDKFYEVMQDNTNGRLWCRVQGTDKACTSWAAGWKRRYAYHSCKHQDEAVRRLGLVTSVRDEFMYVVTPATADALSRTAAGQTWAPARDVPTRPSARPAAPPPIVQRRTERPPTSFPARVPSLDAVRAAQRTGAATPQPAAPSGFSRDQLQIRRRRGP